MNQTLITQGDKAIFIKYIEYINNIIKNYSSDKYYYELEWDGERINSCIIYRMEINKSKIFKKPVPCVVYRDQIFNNGRIQFNIDGIIIPKLLKSNIPFLPLLDWKESTANINI